MCNQRDKGERKVQMNDLVIAKIDIEVVIQNNLTVYKVSKGDTAMNELEVKIVRLEPLRVAYALGYSESPEGDAFDQMMAWAKPRGMLEDPVKHRWFGFNNPNPSPGSPKYGYEVWVTVGEDAEPEDEIKIKEFEGGLYAVTRCVGIRNISMTWKRLVAWQKTREYKLVHKICLEEHIGTFDVASEDEVVLDLFLAIAE